MPEETPIAAPATTGAPVDSKPVEPVVDGAKPAAESTPEESTLLGEEGKKEPAAPVVVPEKYDIKPPEGMTIDQPMLEKLTPVFKELGITQEGAQKLADAYAPQINQMIEAQRAQAVESFSKMVGEWKDQTTKELGNDSQKELAHAAKFIDKFGGPELRQVLNETGLGNHIAVVKAFIAAGKAIANDSFPDSSSKGKSIDTIDEKAAALFRPQNKPKE